MYSGLRCENIIFDGQIAKSQRINLLYDDQHYHGITNLMTAMAKEYECPACNKGCTRGVQHKCDASCDACSAIPSCKQDNTRIPCDECNGHFRNSTRFENHKRLKVSGKTVCEARRRCRECGNMEGADHECNKRYCSQCQKKGVWGVGVKCLLFQTGPLELIRYCFLFLITKPRRKCTDTSYEHYRIWCSSSNFVPCAKTKPKWAWIDKDVVRENSF